MKAEAILNENDISLPEPPRPAGNYQAAIRHDSLLFLSGQFPFANGQLAYRGRLGRELDVATGYQAARLCAINVLAQLQRFLGSFDAVVGIARLEGYVQSAPEFQEHAKVLDGASDLFHHVLGDRGAHTRAVIGVASLAVQRSSGDRPNDSNIPITSVVLATPPGLHSDQNQAVVRPSLR